MRGYVLRRMVGLVPMLLGVILIVCALMSVVPGDPAATASAILENESIRSLSIHTNGWVPRSESPRLLFMIAIYWNVLSRRNRPITWRVRLMILTRRRCNSNIRLMISGFAILTMA